MDVIRSAVPAKTKSQSSTARRVCIAVLLVLLALLPLLVGTYQQLLVTEILIYALFAMSFNLLLGYTGLLSFGHAAFLAAGSYACAFTMVEAELSLWVGIAVGTAAGGLLAAVYGIFCLRVDEIYFALLTLALGMLTYTVFFQAYEITGGDDGYPVYNLGELPIIGESLGRPTVFYYVVLVVVAIGVAVMWLIVSSPFGQTLRAIRENPERVLYFGISVTSYRYRIMVVSGMFAGLAGSLLAPFLRVAGPEQAHWTTSAEAVLASVLGGTAYFFGPGIGMAALIYLESVVTSQIIYWPLIMGILLITLVLFFPRGLTGTAQQGVAIAYRSGIAGTTNRIAQIFRDFIRRK